MSLDFRSDTLTQPTQEMREFMARARVGDSFYDEDPSVCELEHRVAELFSHEAALFVPSGTMSNQIALQLHCKPGEGVFCAPDAHILRAESGALSALAGLQPIIPEITDSFIPNLDSMEELFISSNSLVSPPTKLLSLENTHLFSGGRIHPWTHLEKLSEWCRQKGISIHLDGARLWHAHLETGIPLAQYGALFDTLSVCFSKGLGAPVGSCLISSRENIQRAKLLRKRLGGTMRQCGILAAAALWAMENHLQALKNDHHKAKQFARWVTKIFPEAVIPAPETNIVLLKFSNRVTPAQSFLQDKYNILLSALNTKMLRAVCHRDISQEQLDQLTNQPILTHS